uniref:Uncharacterized protein n=1 Tax=Periophthalmus magnuspinnatus TaxID=409849 RepID=A0A3B4B0G2_9GOBI
MCEGAGQRLTRRDSSRFSGVVGFVLSVLSAAVVLAVLGCVCGLLYPILKGKKKIKISCPVGFWSVLVISLLVASLCSASSWILMHLDSAHSRTRPHISPHDRVRLDYGMAALNGVMAMVTVIWGLS